MERMKECLVMYHIACIFIPSKNAAGLELKSHNVHSALSEVRIESPDWRKIGEKLCLKLSGYVNENTLFKEWKMRGLEMTWEMLAQALDGMKGYQLAARIARQKTGIVLLEFNVSTKIV